MQNGSPPKRFLCLWLPQWPIQRLVVAEDDLRRQHVVLFRQDSRRGQLVAAASPLAQRDGVHIDMPLTESKSLLASSAKQRRSRETTNGGKSQAFHILPHDPAADVLALQQLADDLDSFSPIVGLQQDTETPDCIFLDVTGLAPLFGSEADLARGVAGHCRQQGYLAHIAIANTLGLAQGIAQHGFDTSLAVLPESSVSKSSQSQPQSLEPPSPPALQASPIWVVGKDDHTTHLELPIVALRLCDWTTSTLHQLGIHRLEQLLRLPRKDLAARLGDSVHRRLDQLTGDVAEPLIARKPPQPLYAEQLLDYPTSHRQTLEVIIERLIDKICKQLHATQQGALQWTIRLYHQDKLPLKISVGLFQPTATTEHVLQLATMQLEQLLLPDADKHKRSSRRPTTTFQQNGQPLEITEITVSVTSCVLLTHRQRELFDENPRLDRQALTHLINRLSSRLGRHNVVSPTIVSGAHPEYAYQFRPLVNPHRRGPQNRSLPSKERIQGRAMARPLTMFHPAITIPVVSVSAPDDHTSRAPAVLTVFGHRYSIVERWGPERIETGWWRGPTACREYWRIETESHQQYWIYHDLRKRTWFLHGEF